MIELELEPGVETHDGEGELDAKGSDDGDGTTSADEKCEGIV
jgi:hypothetical protein